MGADFFVKGEDVPDCLSVITAIPERVSVHRRPGLVQVYVKATLERLNGLFENLCRSLEKEGFHGKVLLVDYKKGFMRLAVFEAGQRTLEQQRTYDPAELFCAALERGDEEALEIAEAFQRRLPEKAKDLLTATPQEAKELLAEANLWGDALTFYGKVLDVLAKYALGFGRLASYGDVL